MARFGNVAELAVEAEVDACRLVIAVVDASLGSQ